MKMILCCASLLLLLTETKAQGTQKPVGRQTGINQNKPATTRLQSTGSYPAKSGQQLEISDATINAVNNRMGANNANLYGSNSILGLPRGTYGFARGQLMLRSTGATSIGGVTGNPSVGTGSSSAGVGGNMLGLNGKSPYAGPAVWGSAQGMRQPDSVLGKTVPTNRKD